MFCHDLHTGNSWGLGTTGNVTMYAEVLLLNFLNYHVAMYVLSSIGRTEKSFVNATENAYWGFQITVVFLSVLIQRLVSDRYILEKISNDGGINPTIHLNILYNS